MAGEIVLQTVPEIVGATINAVVFNNDGKVWDTVSVAFVAYVDSDFPRYVVATTEQPTASGRYVGDFPTAIAVAGTYPVILYRQLGATAAPTDEEVGAGSVSWSGSATITPPQQRAIIVQTVPARTGLNAQALIFDKSGNVYDVALQELVAYSDANIAAYAWPLTESLTQPGFYSADFPSAITTPGTYGIIVLNQSGASLASTDEQIAEGEVVWDGTQEAQGPVTAQFCSVAFAASTLGLSAAQTNTDAAFLTQLINAATTVIQRYCRRDFTLTNYSEYYNGSGTRTLTLRQFPISSLVSVTYYPHDATSYTDDATKFAVDKRAGIVSAIPSVALFPNFPKGFQTVLVNYTAGYSEIPADVQYACAMIVKLLYIQRGAGLLAASRKLGDYEAMYFTAAQQIISGSYDVQRLLDQYRDHPL